MKTFFGLSLLLIFGAVWLSGCALTPEQKLVFETTLKQEVDSFVDNSVQGHWDQVYALTDGNLESSDKFKESILKSLPDNGTLTGGKIVSMAWENDKTAKVKINWVFRQGSALGYSSETFMWILKGDTWMYQGRALR